MIFYLSPYIPAYLISFLIGWLVLLTFNKNTSWRSVFLPLFLSIGLGLGISAQLSFYSFLVSGQFHPGLILSANVALLVFLVIINFQRLTVIARKLRFNRPAVILNISIGMFFLLMVHVLYILASDQPYGQWDAWAVWNMKTKFLVFGGESWANIFKLHWHTQPDYPLLLPFINAWVFSIPQNNFNFIPAFTGIVFTLSGAGLLYGGLAQYIPSRIAFLSAAALILLPIYHSLGTSQYADIVLTYYLLASVILLTMTLREKNAGLAVLLGMVLGLMCFTKNEGMVIALLLLLLATIYLYFEKGANKRANLKILFSLFGGHLATLLPTLILKFYLAPPNRDIGIFAFTACKFFNLHNLGLIFQNLGSAMLSEKFLMIWPVFIAMFLLQPRRYWHKEIKILSLFFVLYLFCIVAVYLTTVNFDLKWRLSRTIVRILMIQLPAVMFLHLYAYWREPNENHSH